MYLSNIDVIIYQVKLLIFYNVQHNQFDIFLVKYEIYNKRKIALCNFK